MYDMCILIYTYHTYINRYELNLPDGPYVDILAIPLGACDHIWTAVPEGNNGMSQFDRWVLRDITSQAPISNFKYISPSDQQISTLDVSMQYAIVM